MSPNGRRAWRRAAKKLRRKLGRRWRSQKEWLHGKRSELVPDLEARRGHITGAWFRRHGCTDQGLQTLDAPNMVRVYIGLWGTVDGDGVEYAVKTKSFTARSLVGMSMASRKRAAQGAAVTELGKDRANAYTREYGSFLRSGEYLGAYWTAHAKYRIGERLRPCLGCAACNSTMSCCGCRHGYEPWDNRYAHHICDPDGPCDGSGVLPARKSK